MDKRHFLFALAAVLAIAVIIVLVSPEPVIRDEADLSRGHPDTAAKKKVLFVNSYHAEMGWSKGIIRGVLETFNIEANHTLSNSALVDLKIIHMDTKRNKSEEFIKKAAINAKKVIEEWGPDVVIAADDNASKYLIVPYYKDRELPFVFCGVNWDASVYGFPFSNVTGMVEVNLIEKAIDIMKDYSKGDKVGILSSESLTGRKQAGYIADMISNDVGIEYPANFYEWKKKYIEMQGSNNMLIMIAMNGINDWDREEATQLTMNETSIPTVLFYTPWIEYALFIIAGSSEEQGRWAANTALEILNGKSPKEIPIVRNKEARIYLNMELAKKMGITFPMELIEQATFISEKDL
jgi:hypothetical protein